MSGGQISTVATVGPSVCLLTKEDSLSYNRLIPPPPKDFNLISNENRSNHSFVGGVMVFVSLSAPTTTWNISRVTLAGEGSNGTRWLWRMTNWQAFISLCHLLLPLYLSPMRDREPARHIRGLELMQKLPCWGGGVRRKTAKTNSTEKAN